jgi:hypothetical protein
MSLDDTKPLLVTELIALLQALPPEVQHYPVATEGCDCYGDAAGVTVHEREKGDSYVLITREP